MYIDDWQWLDWTNVPGLLDLTAFVLGGLGIGFTIWQLVKSKGALESAATALDETRSTLMRNQLVFVLPALGELANALESAARTGHRDTVVRALDRITDVGSEAAVLIEDSTQGNQDVVEEIARCVDEASKARALFFSDKTTSPDDLIADASASIRSLTPRIKSLATKMKNDPGGPRA